MYYLLINGKQTGPYEQEEITGLLRQRAIGDETPFWCDGMIKWEAVGLHRGRFERPIQPVQVGQNYHLPQFPPHMQNSWQQSDQLQTYHQPAMPQHYFSPPKSRVAYILLGFFLGGLGIHNFYAGHTGRGIAQLLLTLLLFWTIIVPVAVGVWVIVEIIVVDRDANGVRMN